MRSGATKAKSLQGLVTSSHINLMEFMYLAEANPANGMLVWNHNLNSVHSRAHQSMNPSVVCFFLRAFLNQKWWVKFHCCSEPHSLVYSKRRSHYELIVWVGWQWCRFHSVCFCLQSPWPPPDIQEPRRHGQTRLLSTPLQLPSNSLMILLTWINSHRTLTLLQD